MLPTSVAHLFKLLRIVQRTSTNCRCIAEHARDLFRPRTDAATTPPSKRSRNDENVPPVELPTKIGAGAEVPHGTPEKLPIPERVS